MKAKRRKAKQTRNVVPHEETEQARRQREEGYHTAADLAEEFGMPRVTLYTWLENGTIPEAATRRVGKKHVYILRETVAKLMGQAA